MQLFQIIRCTQKTAEHEINELNKNQLRVD